MFEMLVEDPRHPIERWVSNFVAGFTLNGSSINLWLAGILLVVIELENLHHLGFVHSSPVSLVITILKFLAAAVPYAVVLLLLRMLARLADNGSVNPEAAAEIRSWMRSLLLVIYLCLL